LILLHGIPGTGKTSYIKTLVGRVNKPFIFINQDQAQSLDSPSLLTLLKDYKDSIDEYISKVKATKNIDEIHDILSDYTLESPDLIQKYWNQISEIRINSPNLKPTKDQ